MRTRLSGDGEGRGSMVANVNSVEYMEEVTVPWRSNEFPTLPRSAAPTLPSVARPNSPFCPTLPRCATPLRPQKLRAVEDVKVELAAIQRELSESNRRLFRLISQRLDKFVGSAEELAPQTLRVLPPETLRVQAPNGPDTCAGTYVLVSGSKPNGFPLWQQVDGPHCVYSMSNGKWGVGGEQEVQEGFNSDGAFIFCPKAHLGTMPHKMVCSWKRNNPAWTSDPGIEFEAIETRRATPQIPASPVGGLPRLQSVDGFMRPATPMTAFIRPSTSASDGTTKDETSDVHGVPGVCSMDTVHMCDALADARHVTVPSKRLITAGSDPVPALESIPVASQRGRRSSVGALPLTLGPRHSDQKFSRSKPRFSSETGTQSTVSGQTTSGPFYGLETMSPAYRPSFWTKQVKPNTMFPDVEMQKKRLHDNIVKEQRRREDRYYRTGFCQFVAKQPMFEAVTLFVVVINVLWLGVDVDNNHSTALPHADITFQVMDNIFCTYFTAEILIRFGAFARKWEALTSGQFLIDMFIVSFMIFETWGAYLLVYFTTSSEPTTNSSSAPEGISMMRILRILRITFMGRLIRLMRASPELMVLLKGIRVAAKSVMWTSGLLLIIVYVYAVAFRILCKSNETLGNGRFSSVHKAMATFFLEGLIPDFAPPVWELRKEHWIYSVLFTSFIVVGSVTVMNMLTGMLVQVVSSIADVNQEEIKLAWTRSEMEKVMKHGDANHDELLSKDEIANLLCDPYAVQIFEEVGVDVMQLVDVAEFHIFKDKDEISFVDFLDLVLQLRCSKNACMKDIVHLQQFLSTELVKFEERVMAALSPGLEHDSRVLEALTFSHPLG